MAAYFFSGTITNLKNGKTIACMCSNDYCYDKRFTIRSGYISFNTLGLDTDAIYVLTNVEKEQKYFVKYTRWGGTLSAREEQEYFTELTNNLEIMRNVYEEMYNGSL